jgi:hypothetical protein
VGFCKLLRLSIDKWTLEHAIYIRAVFAMECPAPLRELARAVHHPRDARRRPNPLTNPAQRSAKTSRFQPSIKSAMNAGDGQTVPGPILIAPKFEQK